jgi:hypothetical protein
MKVVRIISKVIIIATLLNIFAYSIWHVSKGGKKFGVLSNPIIIFAKFPTTVSKVFRQTALELPPYYVRVDPNLKKVNHLNKDLFALNARFIEDRYDYELRNLKNDSVFYSWSFSMENFYGDFERFRVAHPQNPILLEDTSIIGMFYGSKNLFRIDKDSKIIWQDTSRVYHHSLNMSSDNYLWACSYKNRYISLANSRKIAFRDDVLTKLDPSTGHAVLEKNLSDLLIENGYVNLVFGCVNNGTNKGMDLFHLNDIEVVNSDGKFWKKGDLLLSLRHRSVIIHYRPSTNKVLRIISGPFLAQHDVDIFSEDEISLFNNNRVATNSQFYPEENGDRYTEANFSISSSNIYIYNYTDSTFKTPFKELFEKQNVYTPKQGLHTYLSDGSLFVESTEQGTVYIFKDNKVVYQDYYNEETRNQTVQYPHWIRIYEDLNFLK